MIYDYLEIIKNDLLRIIPEFGKGIYLARIDDEGRVLRQRNPESNEFEYAGLSDTEGNYFYIRHRDSGEISFEESPNSKPSVSCGQTRFVVRYELRLVASLRLFCPYSLEEKLRSALVGTRFPNSTERRNVSIIPRKSIIDSIAVLKEESPKPKPFDKNLIFVGIDFDLTYEANYF
jgi:hypothetical protein